MARNFKTVIILFAVAVLFGLNHAIGNEIACHKPTKKESPAKILSPTPTQTIDPLVLTAMGIRATEALLDPSVSDAIVSQFDYGVVSNPSTLLSLRSERARKISERELMPMAHLMKYGSSTFMTANRETAEAFSKGSLLTFHVSKAQLQKLYERSELYVGIEYDLEFAFIGENSFQLLTDSVVSSETHKPTGNIWKNRDHHLWRNPEAHLQSHLERGI